MYEKSYPFAIAQIVFYLSVLSEASPRFPQHQLFMGCSQPHVQPPNLEDQGIPFHLGHHLSLVWHGWPYQLCYCQHSSQDPLTTQAPPLCQSKDTIEGDRRTWKLKQTELDFACCFAWVWKLVSSEGEKHRLRVVQAKVLRKIFRLKREKVPWDWKKLHSEDLHDLYSTPSIIWMITSR